MTELSYANAMRIDKWGVFSSAGPYTAPECVGLCLKGFVYGHPRKGDSDVRTSDIVEVRGRLVRTASGSIYALGTIHPKYRKWLRDNGLKYDQHHPIKIREA